MYGWLIKNIESSGDDLYGFEIDVYQYLEGIEEFSNLEVESTSNPDQLIRGSFTFSEDVSADWVISKLTSLWLNKLRYAEFEIHQFEQDKNGVIMNFCTRDGGLGVTGMIRARKIPGDTASSD